MNRLAQESSLYLRQHRENPVDWYPWGPEALERARAENKPILLSIGYSSCHWCHVMAHESFEDPQTAALMNERYVNIKVDREERPDLDAIYMTAVQAMTGHGGWPMTVFLTPTGEPFWGGTYFPPDDRHGMPSFRRVLVSVADAYASRPHEVAKTAAAIRGVYERHLESSRKGLSEGPLHDAMAVASRTFDGVRGGFGRAPKFPPTMLMEYLIVHSARTGTREALRMAHETFRAMSDGGIHDQLGGGFHRYAVDADWLVPHFEKMLYDNALLARCGAHLWQATHDLDVRETTERLLAWVERDMTRADGGFCAALDADTDDGEGRFYTWTPDECDRALGSDTARLVCAAFGVSREGHVDGRSVLHRSARATRPADHSGAVLTRARDTMLAVRNARSLPARDDKAIASWNALMLRGFVACALAFQNARWRRVAEHNASFLRDRVVRDNTVQRIAGAHAEGFLDDHAAVALAFLDMWSLTGDVAWFQLARAIAHRTTEAFYDRASATWFDTSSSHESLIVRPRDVFDNAIPSGASLATELHWRLAAIVGDAELLRIARESCEANAELMRHTPHSMGHWLVSADAVVHGATTIALIGGIEDTEMLTHEAHHAFVPARVIARSGLPVLPLEIFAQRDPHPRRVAAFVCRGTTCDLPAFDASELRERLSRPSPG